LRFILDEREDRYEQVGFERDRERWGYGSSEISERDEVRVLDLEGVRDLKPSSGFVVVEVAA
jgi:hypothetical protein